MGEIVNQRIADKFSIDTNIVAALNLCTNKTDVCMYGKLGRKQKRVSQRRALKML
jgi:hypothetical protein